MNKFYLFLLFSLCWIGFQFMACTSDPKEEPLQIEDVLPGYWELIDATRNGKPVPSLEGAYFEFDTTGNISTNFTGEQVVTDYKILDESILFSNAGKEQALKYQITHPDTLLFKTEMRKIFKFDLTLLRSTKK